MGFFKPEIQGALGKSALEKFSVDKFHQTSRVTQRFTNAFKIAYDSLAAATAREQTAEEGGQPASATGGQTAASAGKEPSSPSKGDNLDKRPELRDIRLTAFRIECEHHCRRELEARLVSLVMEGDHVDIQKSVAATRLYQILTASVPLMGFYDVKNARLCHTSGSAAPTCSTESA